MTINLEYEAIREHFRSCQLGRRSRSVYDNYGWTDIMTAVPSWYARAQAAIAMGELEEATAICFQWMFSFIDAFDNDAFTYDEEGWAFTSAMTDFSDLILKVYDDVAATDELKAAIVRRYDELNHARMMYSYGWLDINAIIKKRGWPIEVIDFKALYEAERKAEEAARQKALEEAMAEKKRRYIDEHFACEYQEPAKRFQRERPLHPTHKIDSANLAKRLMPALRKIYRRVLDLDRKEELLQRLDGYVRTAHLRAVRGETDTALLITEAVIRFINKIREDEKFSAWISDDIEVYTELDKIHRNLLSLNDFLCNQEES